MQALSLLLCVVLGMPLPAGVRQGNEGHAGKPPAPAAQDRVDINHATAEQLMKAPGMTATWAARIVRFKPYRTKQDLVDRGVLPSDVYQRVKDYLIAHHDPQ